MSDVQSLLLPCSSLPFSCRCPGSLDDRCSHFPPGEGSEVHLPHPGEWLSGRMFTLWCRMLGYLELNAQEVWMSWLFSGGKSLVRSALISMVLTRSPSSQVVIVQLLNKTHSSGCHIASFQQTRQNLSLNDCKLSTRVSSCHWLTESQKQLNFLLKEENVSLE